MDIELKGSSGAFLRLMVQGWSVGCYGHWGLSPPQGPGPPLLGPFSGMRNAQSPCTSHIIDPLSRVVALRAAHRWLAPQSHTKLLGHHP